VVVCAKLGACVDNDEGVPTRRADKRRAFVVDQSHSFIGGATVRMGCVGIPVWRNHLLHKWGNYLIPYC
jgi:hypothetical protein